jgi:hypothetical protein
MELSTVGKTEAGKKIDFDGGPGKGIRRTIDKKRLYD